MAEIVSLISGVITLLDFGCKVVSGTRSVRDSVYGTAPDIHELELVLEQIHESHRKYRAHILATRNNMPADDNTLAMITACDQLRKDLAEVIAKLRVADAAKFKTLEEWRVTIRWLRKDKYLTALRERLLALDRHLRRKFEQEMQAKRYASIMAEFKKVEKEKEALGIQTRSTLRDAQAEIIEIVEKGLSRPENVVSTSLLSILATSGNHSSTTFGFKDRKHNDPGNRAEGTSNIKHLISDDQAEAEEIRLVTRIQQLTIAKLKLEVLQKDHASSKREIKVIRSLYFVEVFRRLEKIPKADRSSNEWIFDPLNTSFVSWLESEKNEDGLYYIFGRPGSGKSTLMKFVSDHTSTQQALRRWARTSRLQQASYFFWNQGSEMQRSGVGLFQSLLYQILRNTPDLIDEGLGQRQHHEAWTMDELRETFQKIAASTEVKSKFCFFIDGLDEYEGEEEDLMSMLRVLAAFKHVKICASSRPHQGYEKLMQERKDRSFDIADFTKEDMANHVRRELGRSERFQLLAKRERRCAGIISDISALANGVWLWVHLVTSEIRKEVEQGEGIETLRKIVDEFPSDLDEFFKRMINKIHPRHKEQMAQIFLVTVEQLQPLPLYAFALLEKERSEPHFEKYAIKADIKPFSLKELGEQYLDLRSRVQNRCSYFLIVDDMPHPTYLSHSVDFFHRTSRDFLRDNYRNELDKLVKPDFDPLISLCNICLGLLKGSDVSDFRTGFWMERSFGIIIGLTDELLYYAHEIERRNGDAGVGRLVPILDELDKTNTAIARRSGGTKHWTHARDLPPGTVDVYVEGGNCNFLALTVQARLTGYVRAKLEADPRRLNKNGRPLLDYALRPLRTTPISMRYHSERDETSIDIEMVKLLLGAPYKASPNQPVYLYDGQTVWGLFLISINETGPMNTPENLKNAWFQACRELIRAGAQLNYKFVNSDLTVSSVLEHVFAPTEVMELRQEFAEVERERKLEAQRAEGRCVVQ